MSGGNDASDDIQAYESRKDEPFKYHDAMNGNCVQKVQKVDTPPESEYCDIYVRKWIPIRTFNEPKLAKQAFKKEVKALRAAQNIHVIKLIDEYYIKDLEFVIIMDAADDDLAEILKGEITEQHEPQFISWFTCLAKAIDYVHGLGIRHRDIKPENILVKNGRVLLADFGISAMGLKATISTTLKGRESSKTDMWSAPEVLDGGSRDYAADIFSLGAVYLMMLHALWYWEDKSKLTTLTRHSFGSNLAEVHKHIDMVATETEDPSITKAIDLCKGMLDEDSLKRPDAAKVSKTFQKIFREYGCECKRDQSPSKNERLVDSCRAGSIDEVKKQLSSGAKPEATGAIHQAAMRDDPEFVNTLLREATDKRKLVNQQNYSGQTPLHSAVGYGVMGTIKTLIREGANAAKTDDDGHTALHCAAAYGKEGIVDCLLEHSNNDRAFLNKYDCSGQTALLLAVRRGNYQTARILIKSGADVKLTDGKKRTPLHFAAAYGCIETVKLLLEEGSEVNDDDNEGRTPLYYAAGGTRQGGKFEEVIRELYRSGAKVTRADKRNAEDAGRSDEITDLLHEAIYRRENGPPESARNEREEMSIVRRTIAPTRLVDQGRTAVSLLSNPQDLVTTDTALIEYPRMERRQRLDRTLPLPGSRLAAALDYYLQRVAGLPQEDVRLGNVPVEWAVSPGGMLLFDGSPSSGSPRRRRGGAATAATPFAIKVALAGRDPGDVLRAVLHLIDNGGRLGAEPTALVGDTPARSSQARPLTTIAGGGPQRAVRQIVGRARPQTPRHPPRHRTQASIYDEPYEIPGSQPTSSSADSSLNSSGDAGSGNMMSRYLAQLRSIPVIILLSAAAYFTFSRYVRKR